MAGKGERNRGSAVWVASRGCWQIRVYAADGKRISALQRDLNERTDAHRTVALQRVEEARNAIIAGGLVATRAETVAEYANRWLEYRRGRDQSLTHKEQGVALLVSMFGYLPIHKLGASHLRDYVSKLDGLVAQRKLRYTTARQRWSAIRSMCTDALKSKNNSIRIEGFVNPSHDVEGPDEGTVRRKSFLSPKSFQAILDCPDIDVEVKCLMVLAMYSGMRKGELFGLRWDSVRLDEKQITVHEQRTAHGSKSRSTKTGTSRDIPIEGSLVPLLERLRLFGGKYVVPESWHWRWRPVTLQDALERSGLARKDPSLTQDSDTRKRLTWHSFRASYATTLLVSGVKPWEVQGRLGHGDLDMTKEYVRIVEVLKPETFFVAPGVAFGPLPSDVLSVEPKASRFRIRKSGGGNASGNGEHTSTETREIAVQSSLAPVRVGAKLETSQVSENLGDSKEPASYNVVIPSTSDNVAGNSRTENPVGLCSPHSEMAIATSDESASSDESLSDLKQRLDAAVREGRWADVASLALKIANHNSK